MPARSRYDLEAEHAPARIRRRLNEKKNHGGYIGDAVLGAVDGGITSFVVVAGAVGAGFSSVVVIILGFASLLADGFSMAASNFLGTKSEREKAEHPQREERQHIDQIPDGHREEMRQIFASKGFEGRTLDDIVDTISANRELWAQTVVQELFGLQPVDAGRPIRAGATTFAAFLAIGAIPLLPFVVPGLDPDRAFVTSAVVTSLAFFSVGFLKGRALAGRAVHAGIETLVIGGGAALLAYAVGAILQGWLGGGAAG
jgi:VIT1/CCC1 family predicted Fe2+/Mn2+ transporter